MNYDDKKAAKFYGIRASEIFERYRAKFKNKFAVLEAECTASNLRIFGSIVRGTDTEDSDIDFLVDVKERSPKNYIRIQEVLSDWIRFPVHITMDDGSGDVPEKIINEGIAV